MELTGRHSVAGLLCVGLLAGCGGGDDSCDLGAARRCEEQSGPLEISYCQLDGTWSECTLAVDCNPLTQEGCDDGLACYYDSRTFCASPESYPCAPGQSFGGSCHAHCAHDGRDGVIFDAPECEEDEWCYPIHEPPDGWGICAVRDSGVGASPTEGR